jgi:hypothetical protein
LSTGCVCGYRYSRHHDIGSLNGDGKGASPGLYGTGIFIHAMRGVCQYIYIIVTRWQVIRHDEASCFRMVGTWFDHIVDIHTELRWVGTQGLTGTIDNRVFRYKASGILYSLCGLIDEDGRIGIEASGVGTQIYFVEPVTGPIIYTVVYGYSGCWWRRYAHAACATSGRGTCIGDQTGTTLYHIMALIFFDVIIESRIIDVPAHANGLCDTGCRYGYREGTYRKGRRGSKKHLYLAPVGVVGIQRPFVKGIGLVGIHVYEIGAENIVGYNYGYASGIKTIRLKLGSVIISGVLCIIIIRTIALGLFEQDGRIDIE